MPVRNLKGYIYELFYTYLICRLIASANSSGLLVYIGHSINWKYTPLNKCLLSHFISQSLIFRVPRSGFLPIIYLAEGTGHMLLIPIGRTGQAHVLINGSWPASQDGKQSPRLGLMFKAMPHVGSGLVM